MGLSPMPFSSVPQQVLLLASGRSLVIEVQEDNRPQFRASSFASTFYSLRRVLHWLSFRMRPQADQRWAVLVHSDAALSMFGGLSASFLPAEGSPLLREVLPDRARAEQRAAELWTLLKAAHDPEAWLADYTRA